MARKKKAPAVLDNMVTWPLVNYSWGRGLPLRVRYSRGEGDGPRTKNEQVIAMDVYCHLTMRAILITWGRLKNGRKQAFPRADDAPPAGRWPLCRAVRRGEGLEGCRGCGQGCWGRGTERGGVLGKRHGTRR